MERHQRVKGLAKVFSRLPEEHKSNLRHHAKVGTPVCCGLPSFRYWTDGEGGG